jgi:AcrR family transcriptional regulator
MPKLTFQNLPEEKKKIIEETAVSEFATFGYDKASINRIVEKCKIAKGSFYQYFDDKKDLFLYLIKMISEKKLKYMSPILEKPEQYDFFTLNKKLFASGLKFAAENPEITLMGNWLFKSKDHPIYKEVMDMGVQKIQDVYIGLLKHAILKKEIRGDINLDFISYIISSMNVNMMEYYFQNIKGKETDMRKIDKDIIKIVDLLLDFIKNGIGTQRRKK